MVGAKERSLLAAVTAWIGVEKAVEAAVLFGSQARSASDPAGADGWSDVDLHVVTSDGPAIERIDWARALPDFHFCLRVVRPATGGVRKLTVLFQEGELDLVLVPAAELKQVRRALRATRRENLPPPLLAALNSMATIMQGGYRFLKGAAHWEKFYAAVVRELPGFRIADAEARHLADVFLCEFLWVLQKLRRGELVAAQRILHRSLVETNIVLLHEARVRGTKWTYQQARRVERLVSAAELRCVQASARLERRELGKAAWHAFAGLKRLMAELVPGWGVPAGMRALLEAQRGPRRR